jgi:hypothetical protein
VSESILFLCLLDNKKKSNQKAYKAYVKIIKFYTSLIMKCPRCSKKIEHIREKIKKEKDDKSQ